MERRAPVVNDPEALKYVQQMGARLAMQLPDAPFPFTFALVADVDRSPFGFPGGYILVSTRQFLAARDAAEFAASVAHAMAESANFQSSLLRQPGAISAFFYLGGPGPVPVSMAPMAARYQEATDSMAARMLAGAIGALAFGSNDEFLRLQEQIRNTPRN